MTKEYTAFSQVVLGTVSKENTLLILPFNFNYQSIIHILINYYLSNTPKKKIGIVLSDTEYAEKYERIFAEEEKLNKIRQFIITKTSVERRKQSYLDSSIFILSSKLLYNDIYRGLISPADFSLLIIDDAQYAKGKHSFVKLMDIFKQNNISIRVLGLTNTLFTSEEDLDEVLEQLMITKIDYNKNISAYEYFQREKIITVPLNKQMYNFIFELNRNLEEYQLFLQEQGITNPYSIRKEFSLFSAKVKMLNNKDLQRIILRKAIEFINLLSLKEVIESSGINAGIKFLDNLKGKKLEDQEINSFSSNQQHFVRTSLYKEIFEEMKNLVNSIDHPKFERIVQFIQELQTKKRYSRFLIIISNMRAAEILLSSLEERGFSVKILPTNSSHEKKEILKQFEQDRLNILITTKFIDMNCDAILFFNNPLKFSSYVSRRLSPAEIFIFLTHRSQEERIYHKFKNQEKNIEKIFTSIKIHERLVKNQQLLFKKNMIEKMDARTKAMVNVVKVLTKNRQYSITSKKQKKEEELC